MNASAAHSQLDHSQFDHSQLDRYRPIASPVHTAFVILVAAGNAFLGKIRADEMRHALFVSRPRMYVRTIVFEWLMLAIVIVGLRLHGSSLTALIGNRWRSFQSFLSDLGIAVVLLILSVAIPSLLGPHHSQVGVDPAVRFLLPQGKFEMLLWVLVAISAGICEEAVYRGYFQCQFIAFTRSVPLGIALSAFGFGASHIYQGVRLAALISVSGAILGVAAYYRKTVRSGMMAHAAQDLLALFVGH
jgi:membrane protease YdiL (CAAX protease family)